MGYQPIKTEKSKEVVKITFSTVSCPNCGAPIDGCECEYCKTKFTTTSSPTKRTTNPFRHDTITVLE